MPPANLAVRDRRERGGDIGVAEIDSRAPDEGPPAAEEIDNEGEGKHGSHRGPKRYCAMHKYAFLGAGTTRNLLGSAMQTRMLENR